MKLMIHLLRRIKNGERRFDPQKDAGGDIQKFQAIAKRIAAAERTGWIGMTRPHEISPGLEKLTDLVLILKPLTFEGEQQLATYEASPADDLIFKESGKLNSPSVTEMWSRALARCVDDPDGAVTLARSLAESACKQILDDLKVPYPVGSELPRLYHLAIENLGIATTRKETDALGKILKGCATAVEGVCALRGLMGDAHGKGKETDGADPPDARLAVTVAGAIASFLIAAWETKKRPSI